MSMTAKNTNNHLHQVLVYRQVALSLHIALQTFYLFLRHSFLQRVCDSTAQARVGFRFPVFSLRERLDNDVWGQTGVRPWTAWRHAPDTLLVTVACLAQSRDRWEIIGIVCSCNADQLVMAAPAAVLGPQLCGADPSTSQPAINLSYAKT